MFKSEFMLSIFNSFNYQNPIDFPAIKLITDSL